MQEQHKRASSPPLAMVGILLLASGLLFWRLGERSLYYDEILHVLIERQPWPAFLADMRQGPLHPILAPLLRFLWMRLVGDSELAVRYIPASLGILSVALVFCLGRRIGGERLGLVSALFLAISPLFVMYSRFDKYYSHSVFVGLVSSLAMLGWWRKGGPRWLGYALSYVALIYSHYLAALLMLLAQNLFVLLCSPTRKGFKRQWFLLQILLPLSYVPWLRVALGHVTKLSAKVLADLAIGWKALVLKAAYTLYSFLCGEAIFPWEPAALLVGGSGAILLIMGLVHVAGKGKRADRWTRDTTLYVLLAAFIGLAGGIVLSFRVFPSVPLVDLPNHMLFALPYVQLIMAFGLVQLASRWRTVLLAVYLVGAGWALGSYYQGHHMHNPIFVLPSREVVAQIAARLEPGDLVLAPADSGVPYYAERLNLEAPVWLVGETHPEDLERLRPARLWVVTLGRDTTRAATPIELLSWIEKHYRLVARWGYVPQDPVYRRVKERLLGRPAYRWKLVLGLYVRGETLSDK